MKTIKYILIAVVILIGITSLSIITRSCNTASNMADQTIFNSSKNVYSYEDFHKKYEAFKQYSEQYADDTVKLKRMILSGRENTQDYDNLSMEASGARNMMRRIAQDYNSMSNISYQKIWKSKGLPDELVISN